MIQLNRNYSRREGTEMFSLTETREIERESTYTRKRAENYILEYDVQMQVLEEMALYGYVTHEFILERQKMFAKQLGALVTKLEAEIESGELTSEQVLLNDKTIEEIYARVGKYLGERRELEYTWTDHGVLAQKILEKEEINEVEVEEEKEEAVEEVSEKKENEKVEDKGKEVESLDDDFLS